VALYNAVDDMTAASQELCAHGKESLSKFVAVFGASMTTLCGLWQHCATKVQAKFYNGGSPFCKLQMLSDLLGFFILWEFT
jgi:hypothetical protein